MSEGHDQPPTVPAAAEPLNPPLQAGAPGSPLPSAALAKELVVALDRLARAQRQHRQTTASRLGLTPLQADLLSTLAGGPPPEAAVGELARELGVRQPTLTESATALERKGLVVRKRLISDRRRTWLELTSAGHDAVLALSQAQEELAAAVAGMPLDQSTATYVALLGLIKRFVDTGIIEVARTCLTCRFLAQTPDSADRHCTLLDLALPDQDLRANCPDHEPAATFKL